MLVNSSPHPLPSGSFPHARFDFSEGLISSGRSQIWKLMGVHFNLFSDLNQRGPLGEKDGRGPSRTQARPFGLWAWSSEYGPLLGNNWPPFAAFLGQTELRGNTNVSGKPCE